MLLRHYMMERFLERIYLSEYKDKFILKGGILVTAMIGLNARSTMDLDATLKDIDVNAEDVVQIIISIASVPLDNGISFRIKSIG